MKTTVYLLHFNAPYQHARHYMGSSKRLEKRLQEHRSGHGARLIEVISQAGLTFELARTWTCPFEYDARRLEIRLKRQHNGPKLCPICQAKRKEKHAQE